MDKKKVTVDLKRCHRVVRVVRVVSGYRVVRVVWVVSVVTFRVSGCCYCKSVVMVYCKGVVTAGVRAIHIFAISAHA